MSQQPDQTQETEGIPNPETGVGIGAGQPSTFEPEEDPDAVPDPVEGDGPDR